METVAENEKAKTKTTTITHYDSGGGALAWTSEGTEKWTRNIPGIDGALDATQEASKAPILQLHDLKGNIVGTVGDGESETKLLSTYNSTEFGVPQPGTTPPKYAWLGAGECPPNPTRARAPAPKAAHPTCRGRQAAADRTDRLARFLPQRHRRCGHRRRRASRRPDQSA